VRAHVRILSVPATLFAFVLASGLSSRATAQSPAPAQPPQSPCVTDSTYRQFDFWVGEWSVRPAQAPANAPASALPESRVEKILNGCVLLENWMPRQGGGGKSFNTYNRATRQWEQTWVDGMGSTVRFRGGLEGGNMVYRSEQTGPDGKPRLGRMTFFNLGPGKVRQLWETSADSGKTWTTAFDGMYTKKS
jgi:hypothetical protein